MSNKILIVDDDKAIRVLLTKLLGKEYEVESVECGEDALEIAPRFRPDIVLLDIMMPGIDGHETCRRLRDLSYDTMQIIIVSAKSSFAEKQKAVRAGAHDYVVKPFDSLELQSRISLHFRLLQAMHDVAAVQSEIASRRSEFQVLETEKEQELQSSYDIAVFALAKVAEARDNETGEHLIRMRAYAQILAEQLQEDSSYADQIDDQFLRDLYRSSPLHDIGKVGIRDDILLKPGNLTADEFATMKQHSVIGANILDEVVRQQQAAGFLEMAAGIARFHHERFDGSGYMAGLVGREIPLSARIVALADVYDALTSSRPYKDAFSTDKAKRMIEEETDKHFDPIVVEAFRARFDDFLCVPEEVNRTTDNAQGTMSFCEPQIDGMVALSTRG
ncbi:MAG: response regulator [Planctomycetes bacterium]|nr:response regulator [Planctomycetota bacterium]